jgi:hypothetical protein
MEWMIHFIERNSGTWNSIYFNHMVWNAAWMQQFTCMKWDSSIQWHPNAWNWNYFLFMECHSKSLKVSTCIFKNAIVWKRINDWILILFYEVESLYNLLWLNSMKCSLNATIHWYEMGFKY